MLVFNIGNIVVLKSNPSVKMTVEGCDSFNVDCVWFDESNNLKRERFPKLSLMLMTEGSKPMDENILLG